METPAIKKYLSLMWEVNHRIEIVLAYQENKIHAIYPIPTAECIYLQLRKILETIAFASLVANKKLYSDAHRDFAKHWNAELLLRDLERINPEFYPKPVEWLPASSSDHDAQWKSLQETEYLNRSKFLKLYKKCGAVLHARNPFGTPIRSEELVEESAEWLSLIHKLMFVHQIRLAKDPSHLYLIHLKEARDGKPHHYTFEARKRNLQQEVGDGDAEESF